MIEPSSNKPTTLLALRHGGTHLIQPLIRQLTGKPVHVPKGEHSLACVPGEKLVVFLRDPRNRTVSHFRYKNPGVPAEEADRLIARMLRRRKDGQTPVGFMALWAAIWANHPGALVVRFEKLLADPKGETERLREYLDAPGSVDEAISYTIGRSGTYTGRHSQWEEWFGPRTRKAWAEQGGDQLVEMMGYEQ